MAAILGGVVMTATDFDVTHGFSLRNVKDSN
jgi:hypothetical protein